MTLWSPGRPALLAASLGFALARRVESVDVALLIAGLATAADLFSVFPGPVRALVEDNPPPSTTCS